MGRLLAIDYGKVRTGLAVTDPLKIIATALDTVKSPELLAYLKKYTEQEAVEVFVLGLPISLKSEDTPTTAMVREFAVKLQEAFPEIPVKLVDERFTSKMAMDSMIASGTKKKDRQIKGNTDKVSAVIILQSFMQTL
jgi:putative Holliday junction resolvase